MSGHRCILFLFEQITQSAVSDSFYRVSCEGMDLAQILVQRKPLGNCFFRRPLKRILFRLRLQKESIFAYL